MFTVYGFNYSHSDYNHPYYKRNFESRQEAVAAAEAEFKRLSSIFHGRVEVAPINPRTGLHDLPEIWKRERPFPLCY